MYYKVEKTSETGQKLSLVADKIIEARTAMAAKVIKHGADGNYEDRFCAVGGIEIMVFEYAPDPMLWKPYKIENVKNGYTPNLKTKAGKALSEELRALPKVGYKEINQCVGFNSASKHIGFDYANRTKYFGITTNDDWKLQLPEDCIEITSIEYINLFSHENKDN